MHPFISRHILFPLQERLKGKNTHAVLKDLETSQWLSGSEMQELQFRRLQKYLQFAYDNTTYYREVFDEHGCRPNGIQDFEDFQRLPYLTRELLREKFESLRSTERIAGIQKMSTGGSTGSPVTVLVDVERNSFIDAARLRAHRWFHADMGCREIVLWGSPIEITRQDRVRILRDRLLNSRLLSAFNLGDDKLAEYADVLSDYRPVKMYGYASALYLLARYFQKTNRQPPKSLKVIFATAEPLFNFQRQAIGQAFKADVVVEYGARDAGLMGTECPKGGLHIPAEGMLVEVDRPAHDGLGEIVVTNLFAKAMPLIRYRTGDIGEIAKDSCSCGRGLPTLKRVEGRQTDFIITSDKRVVHALAVIYILRDCTQIAKFQVVQEVADYLRVSIVPNGTLNPTLRNKIILDLRKVLGPAMQIDLICVNDIPVAPSGKFRYVISKVAVPNPAV
jgi:phenylacetate-coenzyme A ligase PaaK-like adenylate-forming protein